MAIHKIDEGANHKSGDFAYDFVFLDPPYAASDEYKKVITFLSQAPFVNADTIVIAEHTRKFELPEEFPPLERVRVLKQGDAVLSFYRHRAPT